MANDLEALGVLFAFELQWKDPHAAGIFKKPLILNYPIGTVISHEKLIECNYKLR